MSKPKSQYQDSLSFYRLRSLYEVYEVDAELFIRLGEAFLHIDEMFQGGILGRNQPVGINEMNWLRDNLPVLAEHCEHLQLPVTRRMIDDFYRDFNTQAPTWNDAFVRLSCLKQSFKAELQSRLCLFVHSHKSQFYVSRIFLEAERLFGDAVYENFKSTRQDVDDAGRCFAFEQNTACVFHSMRILEKGLHAFAEELGLKPKVPIVLQEWHNIIEQIEAKIDGLQGLPRSIQKTETLKFYSGAAIEFR